MRVMQRAKWIRRAVLGLAVGVCLSSIGCTQEDSKQPKSPAGKATQSALAEKRSEEKIELSKSALQTVAFQTVPAQRRKLEQEIRATAVIKPNENRLAHVSPRIPGKAIVVKVVL